MAITAVVTDSTASIPENLLNNLHIYQVAYYIHRGNEVLRDLVSIKRKEFLNWLPTAVKLPTTACPGMGDYLKLYKQLAEQGVREIISIHMTSHGSGAYQAAKAAKTMLLESLPHLHIEVIDTLNVSLCQGWIAIESARAVMAGKQLPEILEIIKQMIPRVHMLQTADTLRYLYMGGRIGKAVHLMGSMLSLKPLISMENGEIVSVGVARGLTKAYEKMIDRIQKNVGENTRIKIAYVHAGALEQIEKLREIAEKKLTITESFTAELSPALMVHTGPGTTGLCYYSVLD